MFSVITNIYNKKTKGPTLMELFTATVKLKKVFFDNLKCSMCHPWCQKKTFFNFPVAVKNSIKVCPLVFLL